MKEFIVSNGREKFKMILPTSIKEITNEYLTSVTEQVYIAPYHAVVAIVYRCKLPEIISSSKKSRALATAIVPLYVKGKGDNFGEDDLDILKNIKTGNKLIIAGTDIERGYAVTCPNNFITIDNIVKIYNSDNNFAKEVMIDQNYYYFVDFKLVPINDIKGFYKDSVDTKFINPFIIKELKTVN